MHYTYLFLLSSALSIGFSIMSADSGSIKVTTTSCIVEAKNNVVAVQVFYEIANKCKKPAFEPFICEFLERNDNTCLRGIYQHLKKRLEKKGYEVTEERFVISRCNIPNSNIPMDANHTVTIAQLAGYEPYTLEFIFKDPRRTQ